MFQYLIFAFVVFAICSTVLSLLVLLFSKRYKLPFIFALIAVIAILSLGVFIYNFYDLLSGFADTFR